MIIVEPALLLENQINVSNVTGIGAKRLMNGVDTFAIMMIPIGKKEMEIVVDLKRRNYNGS